MKIDMETCIACGTPIPWSGQPNAIYHVGLRARLCQSDACGKIALDVGKDHSRSKRGRYRTRSQMLKFIAEAREASQRHRPRPTIGLNVQDELTWRSDCRYGLKGCTVSVAGMDGHYVVTGSDWGEDGSLKVCARPEEIVRKEHAANKAKGVAFETMTLAEFLAAGSPEDEVCVNASECTLLSEWPVVCPCWLD